MEETNYFLFANPFPAKVVQPNIVKIKGHNYFKGVYPSIVLMNLDARIYIILPCVFIELKDEVVFSCFSGFHCYSKRIAGN